MLIVASIGNVLSAVTFGGAIATIFPLFSSAQGFSAGAIGTMFAVRALCSTAFRLPSGALASHIGSGRVLIGALIVQVVAVTGMGTAQQYEAMLAWLVLEGIGFGAFLASSQAFIAEHTIEETRGAAIGFYSMTGGIGNALAPLALGVVANVFGLGTAFFVAGGLGVVGLAVMGSVWTSAPAQVRLGRLESRA
jgi:MFS family permease